MYNTNNMNSTITTDSNEIAHHTFTNVEFSGFFVKFEISSFTGDKTWFFQHFLFIKYGDKVYVDYKNFQSIGEKVISFAELQKNLVLKYYYDLSHLLTNNKHLVIQKSKNKNVEPFYGEDRFWAIDTTFVYATSQKQKVVDNEHFCYYKINPYDLENMEYTSQEVSSNYWNGRCYVPFIPYDVAVINHYINIIEKELDELSTIYEDKKNVLNIVALSDKEGINCDILMIIYNNLVSPEGNKKYAQYITNHKIFNKLELFAKILSV
jgi:hypothetical protein